MSASPVEIFVAEDIRSLSRKAAELIVAQLIAGLRTKKAFSVALCGGSTPKYLYCLLADDSAINKKIPWEKLHFFWGDERHVAPDHPQSNYRMANEAMLTRLPLPPQNIHRVKSEHSDADEAANLYEQEIVSFFQLEPGQLPRFDCVLLGMGPDGHTASLFPETAALHEEKRLVVANRVEKLKTHRITMTVPVLNNAELVIFLVSGEDKAATLKGVLEGERNPEQFPSQLIEPVHGKLWWLVDRAAAQNLR